MSIHLRERSDRSALTDEAQYAPSAEKPFSQALDDVDPVTSSHLRRRNALKTPTGCQIEFQVFETRKSLSSEQRDTEDAKKDEVELLGEERDEVEISYNLHKMGFSPKQTYTALHELCRTVATPQDLWKQRDLINVAHAACQDSEGRLPLHYLSMNVHLAEALAFDEANESHFGDAMTWNNSNQEDQSNNERILLQFMINNLFKAYPVSMMTPDNNGKVPFEQVLIDWVDESHFQHRKRKINYRIQFAPHFTQIAKTLAGSRWKSPNGNVPDSGSMPSPDVETAASPRSPMVTSPSRREKQFPKGVRLTAPAYYAIKLLSALVKHLEKQSQLVHPSTAKKSLVHRRKPSDVDLNTSLQLERLQSIATLDVNTEIINSIAAIPDLVKTVLLIKDDAQRGFVLSSSIMKRSLANKSSVGNWLTAMIQCDDRNISDLAVGYLKLVSEEYYGPHHENKDARIEPIELHLAVSQLDNFVPSLLSLDESDVEEISTLRLVQRVLDRMIARPFTVTVVFCDALFLAILITFFRGAVNRLLLGYSPSTILNFIYFANVGVFYFIIREIGKAMSLMMITKQTRIYLWSFWNLTDLLSTILSLFSTIVIRTQFHTDDTDFHLSGAGRGLLAVTTGFMWLRVLNHLKAVNMQLATFILAIFQITRDILWFCVIMLTLVVSFAQMFFTILAPRDCTNPSTIFQNRECAQAEYYFKVYAILLGDFGTFDRDQFTTVFSVILIVVYTFMVVLVLLNVLIAIASDSYEKCLVRSKNLFGRARVMLIAEMVSFQNILHYHVKSSRSSSSPKAELNKSWWSSESCLLGWSRGSVLFFGLSSFVVVLWVASEFAGYFSGARHGNVVMSMASILINVALYIGIMVFLSTGAADMLNMVRKGDDDDSNAPVGSFGHKFCRGIRGLMLRVLSTSRDNPSRAESEEWRGRMLFIQNEMERVTAQTRHGLEERMNELEEAISETEGRLHNKMTAIEASLEFLKSMLVQQMNRPSSVGEELQHTMSFLLENLAHKEQQLSTSSEQST